MQCKLVNAYVQNNFFDTLKQAADAACFLQRGEAVKGGFVGATKWDVGGSLPDTLLGNDHEFAETREEIDNMIPPGRRGRRPLRSFCYHWQTIS